MYSSIHIIFTITISLPHCLIAHDFAQFLCCIHIRPVPSSRHTSQPGLALSTYAHHSRHTRLSMPGPRLDLAGPGRTGDSRGSRLSLCTRTGCRVESRCDLGISTDKPSAATLYVILCTTYILYAIATQKVSSAQLRFLSLPCLDAPHTSNQPALSAPSVHNS